jgi:sugar phosphate isomerase/epimerase
MKRRDFLRQSTAGFFTAYAGTYALAGTVGPAKLDRIAISSYCFHNFFPSTRYEGAPKLEGKPMELLDLPEMFADRYRVHNLEVVAPHFASQEPSYLREVVARLKRTHSHIVNMPVDIGELWDKPGLSSADEKTRVRAVSLYKPWFDAAHAVGARSVRCDPGKINSSDLTPTIKSYRELAAYAKPLGLYVIVENHGGVGSEHPEELVRILSSAGEQTGTLPDFGNFPDEATRERGLKALFPQARTVCHVRDTEGDGKGGLVHFDLNRCLSISREAGYKGLYSIEAEANGDVFANIQHVLDEVLKFL